MKRRVKKAVNKNLKLIIAIAAIVAVGFGGILVLISGNADNRDQVQTEQMEQHQEKKEERKKAVKDDHPGVSDEALALYNAGTANLSDTGAVAQLTETMDLRKNIGPYMVTLQITEEENTCLITFDKEFYENEAAATDEAINMYAQQLLALIEDADKINWTYKMKKDNKVETVEGSLTTKQASDQLKLKIKEYGKTPEMVQTLLNSQKGIT
ncbi:MAG: DUF4825 domain-containing protein [Firmicutes bacterium]|nr:DUF4825 domain-containing protein [Bacillota bacterium]